MLVVGGERFADAVLGFPAKIRSREGLSRRFFRYTSPCMAGAGLSGGAGSPALGNRVGCLGYPHPGPGLICQAAQAACSRCTTIHSQSPLQTAQSPATERVPTSDSECRMSTGQHQRGERSRGSSVQTIYLRRAYRCGHCTQPADDGWGLRVTAVLQGCGGVL